MKLRYPLAFNLEGHAVRIPRNAWAWRVSRVDNASLAQRRGGECRVVKMADGSPLHIALESTLLSLSTYVACGGVYRLDAVDEVLFVLREVEPIYVELPAKNTLDPIFSIAAAWLAERNLTQPLPRRQETRPTLALEAHHGNS